MTITALFVGGPKHGESMYLEQLNGGEFEVRALADEAFDLMRNRDHLIEKVPVKVGKYSRINPHVVRKAPADESTRTGDEQARFALSHLWARHREYGQVTLFWTGWEHPHA